MANPRSAKPRSFLLLALLPVATTLACAPAIVEQRMGYYPPKSEGCPIAVVNGAMQNPMMWAAPNSEYQLVGSISLHETGTADPFSDEYLSIVRPRACRMGGDAVSLMMSSHADVTLGSSTGTDYAVLKKREGAGGAQMSMTLTK